MGWKAVKEHYRIEHLVQVTADGICIGSGYIHNIIVISVDRGEIVKRYDPGRGWSRNEDLDRYQDEMDANPFKLAELVAAEDVFARSIPVFTYEGGRIVEKQCEELGWPNVTHDGCMQFENTFSPDSGLVRTWAMDSAKAGIKWGTQLVADKERELAEASEYLAKREADLIALQLTPAQVRLLKSLQPIKGEERSFTYINRGGGAGDGLQSGSAMFRRGLVEPDPAMPRCAQHSCTRTRGFIVLSELGARVHAAVTGAT